MPTLITDPLPLQQIFTNLISNAIKHHDRCDGKVFIAAQEMESAYEFSIRDDGPGIDPKFHEKIFIIFQTLQARDTVENTGVGLAIIKKILDDKGGTIKVESEPEKGTTFRFTWRKE
jgi:signal transduction histidine kinase